MSSFFKNSCSKVHVPSCTLTVKKLLRCTLKGKQTLQMQNTNNFQYFPISCLQSIGSGSDGSDGVNQSTVRYSEFLDMKKALLESQTKVHHLVQTNTDLKQEIAMLQNMVSSLREIDLHSLGKKDIVAYHIYKGSCFRWLEDMWRAYV